MNILPVAHHLAGLLSPRAPLDHIGAGLPSETL